MENLTKLGEETGSVQFWHAEMSLCLTVHFTLTGTSTEIYTEMCTVVVCSMLWNDGISGSSNGWQDAIS